MSDIALTLGPVIFQAFELPPSINFGGQQRLAIHQLAGDRRVVDTMGATDSDISFSGVFSGPDATMRARILDSFRIAGDSLPLTWDVFLFSVVISTFEADYRNSGWIPYRIQCAVVQDDVAESVEPVVVTTSGVLADIQAAFPYASSADVDFSGIASAFSASGAFTRGTAAFVAAQQDIDVTRAVIASQVSQVQYDLERGIPGDRAGVSTAVAGLMACSEATRQLSHLTIAGAYLGRAAANFKTVSA